MISMDVIMDDHAVKVQISIDGWISTREDHSIVWYHSGIAEWISAVFFMKKWIKSSEFLDIFAIPDDVKWFTRRSSATSCDIFDLEALSYNKPKKCCWRLHSARLFEFSHWIRFLPLHTTLFFLLLSRWIPYCWESIDLIRISRWNWSIQMFIDRWMLRRSLRSTIGQESIWLQYRLCFQRQAYCLLDGWDPTFCSSTAGHCRLRAKCGPSGCGNSNFHGGNTWSLIHEEITDLQNAFVSFQDPHLCIAVHACQCCL